MADSNDGRVISRRNLLVIGAGAGLVSACGGTVAGSDTGDNGDAMSVDDANTMNPDDAAMADDTGTSTCTGMGTLAGVLDDFPMGTWTTAGAARAIVAHDAGGLYAYSNVCTHEGCTLGRPTATGVTTCPCHFSQFDGNGAVLVRPATRALAHFAVNVCDGNVYVNRAMTVPASTRTPV